MKLDEGKKLGGVHRCYQITGIEDRALNLEIPAGFVLRVVVVDQTLDFRCFDNWIECLHLICNLDHLSRYRFPRNLHGWGKEIGVEALKEITKTFGAVEVLVMDTRSVGKLRTVLVDPRRSVFRRHPCRCVPGLRGSSVCTS